MRILLMIIFFVLFISIVSYYCKSINKIKKEIEKEIEKKTVDEERRQRLEMENTEFDYGHNINRNENKEYYGGQDMILFFIIWYLIGVSLIWYVEWKRGNVRRIIDFHCMADWLYAIGISLLSWFMIAWAFINCQLHPPLGGCLSKG